MKNVYELTNKVNNLLFSCWCVCLSCCCMWPFVLLLSVFYCNVLNWIIYRTSLLIELNRIESLYCHSIFLFISVVGNRIWRFCTTYSHVCFFSFFIFFYMDLSSHNVLSQEDQILAPRSRLPCDPFKCLAHHAHLFGP